MKASIAALILMCAGNSACARSRLIAGAQPCPSLTREAPDSIRGVVRLEGTVHHFDVVLITADSSRIRLEGDRSILSQFILKEIVVFGALTMGREGPFANGSMTVVHSVVRKMSTGLAYDGVLHREATGDVLVTCGGKRFKLGTLPADLPPDGARIVVSDPEFPSAIVHLRPGTP